MGVALEYTDELGNIQRVERGNTNDTAKYLRFERKEDSVYAYESDDGVNFALVTMISLLLPSSYDTGLHLTGQLPNTMASFSEVVLQVDNSQEKVIHEETKTIGNEIIDGEVRGGEIIIPSGINCGADFCDYALGVNRSALKEEADVRLQVIEGLLPYDLPNRRPVGNAVKITLPFSTLNLETERYPSLSIVTPVFEGEYDLVENISVDVNMLLADGNTYAWTQSYIHGFPNFITAPQIKEVLDQYPELEVPNILSMTFVPYADLLGGASPDQSFSTQAITGQADTVTAASLDIGATEDYYIKGLFHIPDNFQRDDACSGEIKENLNTSTRTYKVPEGKTPLVLVHGWILLNDFRIGDVSGLGTVGEYPNASDACLERQSESLIIVYTSFSRAC